MNDMTPRERLLAALRREPVDRVPCSPFFNPLTPQQRAGHRYQFPWGPSDRERIEYCVQELQLDPVASVGVGTWEPEAGVTASVELHGATITKTWTTPAGDLRAVVRYDEQWPHRLDIPFYSDFTIAHFVEPWICEERDVECLEHILLPPRSKAALEQIRFHHRETRALAEAHGLALLASVGSGLTGMQQLCGPERLCLMTIDSPDLVHRYLELEHRLNLAKIEIAGDLGADIIRRNGFYETSDLYSPQMLEEFLAQRLREEIRAAHAAGALTGYTVHTGVMPILDHLAGLEFDCIMQIDTAFKGVDLPQIAAKLGDHTSFWMGPSNTYHMWSDDPDVPRRATAEVFEVFGPRGLAITACPSSHSIMPWENSLAMIEECRRLGASGA